MRLIFRKLLTIQSKINFPEKTMMKSFNFFGQEILKTIIQTKLSGRNDQIKQDLIIRLTYRLSVSFKHSVITKPSGERQRKYLLSVVPFDP